MPRHGSAGPRSGRAPSAAPRHGVADDPPVALSAGPPDDADAVTAPLDLRALRAPAVPAARHGEGRTGTAGGVDGSADPGAPVRSRSESRRARGAGPGGIATDEGTTGRRGRRAAPEPDPPPDADPDPPDTARDADVPAAGHGHGHSPAAPAGRRVRVLLAALLGPFALAALVGLVLLRPTGGPPPTAAQTAGQPVRGQVVETAAEDCTEGDGRKACTAVTVSLTDGPRAGNDLVQVVPREPGTPQFAVGDPVVLSWSGSDPDDPATYQLVDFQRGGALGWLAVAFAVAVLLLGRWRGLAALVALGVGFAVLLLFVLPAILSGRNPLAVAVVGAGVIMFAVLYLTHGLSARTSTAVVGTLVSLALIGGLGAVFSATARLTGLDEQTNSLITSLGTGVDARGLLLAGMVIGALGVLDDVTVTQTSAVWELHAANPKLGTSGLFRAAMRIGRDHVASAVNTLVLAYAGAALPLLLIFQLSGRGLSDVLTSQDVAMEIVRTLVGSIGLVASVPVTTAVAALVASREEADPTAPARAGSPRRRARGAAASRGRGTPRAARPALPGTGRAPRLSRTAR